MGQLEAERLVKVYGRRTVVQGVDFQANRGEIVGLLGPNGAGKTTIFSMILGLTKPNSGRIFLDGREITQLPMYKRTRLGLGYLPQEPSVFRKLTVEENLRGVLELRRDLSKAEQAERLEHLLAEFNLREVRHQKGYQLSGGERRRTEIARALALDPAFIFLDEPFAGVDPIAVGEIQDIVAHLRSSNLGIIITDHNVRETLRITDRAYIIHLGKVLVAGTTQEVAADELARKYYLGANFTL
ncbi:MAG: LPS export ABC transporter ATP-binding protein [Limnochordia bacterium]|jgi:lipopolysaccharide export system ATP-binding protein|nr:LPS export ABC transporter ATP-binding protein [Limnochordia bacterium]MDI9464414.1 LPS export ABC transporter ATP-binding protein [Bacillota bacterium]NLO95015.1 LPS export ABC transporter ATP-binding protein [Bacillota bacterium]HAN94339.1 LPS export ABC transporter ATP-binding protein [Bacillota bacterium]HOB39672.1 LPS export ABC transporter ATP-binding protein [Limnochordia bacterium]